MFSSSANLASAQRQERFIIAQLDELLLLFATDLVAEIIMIETAQILSLPLYSSDIIGCIHQEGAIILLVSLYQLLGKKSPLSKEKLKVVRLGTGAGNLMGVGIVVDKLLGIQEKAKVPADVLKSEVPIVINEQKMCLFQTKLLEARLWQPRHWQDPNIHQESTTISSTAATIEEWL